MFEPIEICKNDKPIYSITFCNNYNPLKDYLVNYEYSERKICVITDSNVSNDYLESFLCLIRGACIKCCFLVFKAGESSKHTGTIDLIYEKLITEHFDRNDLIIALGGGVTGDMTGFAASTYLRGIKFIQIPTSLLAMVDSSIGGKTGVDFHGYKNMIGAFHMPSAVFINISVLSTLPDREYISGFAEIIKHALIMDKSYYEFLKQNSHEAINKTNSEVLQSIIYKSCLIKKSIVDKDPKEKGIRAYLNFGHTIGHAIEKYMNFELLHGECVALGCICALFISVKKGLLEESVYSDVKQLFKEYKLPVQLDKSINYSDIINITKSDKKTDGKSIKFVLLHEIGNAFIDTSVSDNEILEALMELKGEINE